LFLENLKVVEILNEEHIKAAILHEANLAQRALTEPNKTTPLKRDKSVGKDLGKSTLREKSVGKPADKTMTKTKTVTNLNKTTDSKLSTSTMSKTKSTTNVKGDSSKSKIRLIY
jgi:hypothetical protein